MVTWYDFWLKCLYHPFYINKDSRFSLLGSVCFSQGTVPQAHSTSQPLEVRAGMPACPPGSPCHHQFPPPSAYHLPHIMKPYVCPGPQNISAWSVPHTTLWFLELSHQSQSFLSPWTPSECPSEPSNTCSPPVWTGGACCEFAGTGADPRRTPLTKC